MRLANVTMFAFLLLVNSIAIHAKSFSKIKSRQQQQSTVEQKSNEENSTLSSMLKDAVQLVKMNEEDSQTTWAKDHYELEQNITTLNQEINYLVTSTKDAETQLLILDNEIHDTKAALEKYKNQLSDIDKKILEIEKEDIKNNELKEDLEKKYNDVIGEIEDIVEKISVVSQEDLNKIELSQENKTVQQNSSHQNQIEKQQQKKLDNQSDKQSKIGSFELPIIGDMFNFIQKDSNQTEEEDIDEEFEEEDNEEKTELMNNVQELSKLYDELKAIMKSNEDKEVEEEYKTALFTFNLDRFKLSKKIEETSAMVETLVENKAEIEKQYAEQKKELSAKEEEISRLIKTKTQKQNEFNEQKAKRQNELSVFNKIIEEEKKKE